MLNLNSVILSTTIIVLLITSGLIVLSLLRLQWRMAHDQPLLGTSNPVLDLIWKLIPIGILILLLVLTYQAVTAPAENSMSTPSVAPATHQ